MNADGKRQPGPATCTSSSAQARSAAASAHDLAGRGTAFGSSRRSGSGPADAGAELAAADASDAGRMARLTQGRGGHLQLR